MIKKKILTIVLFFLSVNVYCQGRYDFKGYYIKTGKAMVANDSVIKYTVYNCIFIPVKKITEKRIKKISNKNISKLANYGKVYNILPVSYNKSFLNKIYDSLSTIKMYRNFGINFNSLNLRPYNFISFNVVNEIEFSGIFKLFRKDQLKTLFSEYKINDDLFEIITLNEVTKDSEGNTFEQQVKKKRYLQFCLCPPIKEDDNLYETVMIYDCKLENNSKEM